ncbi:hypothetical protein EQG41_12930 [Billgrantia azerbaijanica]|nr:hypothetical protein EQG41_12930 [Halomonas azerbaijanica]
MNIRVLTVALLVALLGAGQALAMDSEYLEQRRKALEQEATPQSEMATQQLMSKRRAEEAAPASPQGHGEQTREALDPWWR